MYDVSALENFSSKEEFLNINNIEDYNKALAECDKLTYLKTYPTVIRSRIREVQNQIGMLEVELSLKLNESKSFVEMLKRRKHLEDKYEQLKKLRENLIQLKQELALAFHIKNLAVNKLEIYKELLLKFNVQEVVNNDSD